MTHRLIFRCAAFVGLVFGVMLMFVPDPLLHAYGGTETLNNVGRYMAMLFGAAITGFAIMNWAASSAPDIAETHYVMIGNLVTFTLGFVIALYRQLMGVDVPDTAWFNVAINLAFAGLFGYLYMSSPAGYRLHSSTRHA